MEFQSDSFSCLPCLHEPLSTATQPTCPTTVVHTPWAEVKEPASGERHALCPSLALHDTKWPRTPQPHKVCRWHISTVQGPCLSQYWRATSPVPVLGDYAWLVEACLVKPSNARLGAIGSPCSQPSVPRQDPVAAACTVGLVSTNASATALLAKVPPLACALGWMCLARARGVRLRLGRGPGLVGRHDPAGGRMHIVRCSTAVMTHR